MATESQEQHAPLLVSRSEAARLLAVTPRTISNLASAGYLRAVKIGRLSRFDLTQLTVFAQLGTGGARG